MAAKAPAGRQNDLFFITKKHVFYHKKTCYFSLLGALAAVSITVSILDRHWLQRTEALQSHITVVTVWVGRQNLMWLTGHPGMKY